MDLFIEWVIQLVIDIVVWLISELAVEAAVKAAAHTIANRVARVVLGSMAGFGFGAFWGHHLSGRPEWPRLLWVSTVLGVVALVLAAKPPSALPRGNDIASASSRRALRLPPWKWNRERFVGFAAINAGLAIGILIFFPAH